jgi:hypothetical protein
MFMQRHSHGEMGEVAADADAFVHGFAGAAG